MGDRSEKGPAERSVGVSLTLSLVQRLRRVSNDSAYSDVPWQGAPLDFQLADELS